MTADQDWLREAVELARRCPPSMTAFSVGALLVAHGRVIATGYSREEQPADHAEEVALRKLPAVDVAAVDVAAVDVAARDLSGVDLAGATMYSSLEPCSKRSSRPRSCTELILAAGLRRVVFAWREPARFVDGRGAELLAAAGVELLELPELAPLVREVNAHLFS